METNRGISKKSQEVLPKDYYSVKDLILRYGQLKHLNSYVQKLKRDERRGIIMETASGLLAEQFRARTVVITLGDRVLTNNHDLNNNEQDTINYMREAIIKSGEPEYWGAWMGEPIKDEDLSGKTPLGVVLMQGSTDPEFFRNAVVSLSDELIKNQNRNIESSAPKIIRLLNITNPELLISKDVDGTIVLVDISGFTALSERISPSKLADINSRFFSPIANIIGYNKGVVAPMPGQGDAVMAIFNAPLEIPYPNTMAILSALQIHDEINRLNDLDPRDPFNFRVKITINFGRVTVGMYGSDSPEYKNKNYSAYGEPVNIASRMQKECEAGATVITQQALDKCKKEIENNGYTLVTRHLIDINPRGSQKLAILHLVDLLEQKP